MKPQIKIFDTTMRDGELASGIKMNIQQKIALAKLLEEMGIDIIEVGYPGAFQKDFEEIVMISELVKNSIICGLASTNPKEILSLAQALKSASRGRIHLYTPVNLKELSAVDEKQVIEAIRANIQLARNFCDDIEWSAFDAARSQSDFLCKTVETSIAAGATTVNIPDTLGSLLPKEFSSLIVTIVNKVPNIDRAIISVHCHDDLGLAVENSLAALECGVRQIECSIHGLGARKGNANLAAIAREIAKDDKYITNVNLDLIGAIEQLVSQIVKKKGQTNIAYPS
jgi:2-isopropylmalate synthase